MRLLALFGPFTDRKVSFPFPFLSYEVMEEALDYEQSLFFLGPSSKTPETRKWPRAAALVSRVSRRRRSTFARALKKRETARSVKRPRRHPRWWIIGKVKWSELSCHSPLCINIREGKFRFAFENVSADRRILLGGMPGGTSPPIPPISFINYYDLTGICCSIMHYWYMPSHD